MKAVRLAFIISLILSLAGMSAAFLHLGGWIQPLIGLLIGVQWAWLTWTGHRTYSFFFLILLAFLIYAAVLNLPAFWLLVSLVALLAAWDLSEFSSQLARFSHGQVRPSLVRNHLQRVILVAGAGFTLGASALLIKIQLGFEAAVLLGLLVFVGIAGAVRFLRGTL